MLELVDYQCQDFPADKPVKNRFGDDSFCLRMKFSDGKEYSDFISLRFRYNEEKIKEIIDEFIAGLNDGRIKVYHPD